MLPTYDGVAASGAPSDTSNSAPRKNGDHPLKGKRIYIPPMAYGSARAFASAFRAIGLEAEPTPPSDNRTRELGARYTSGDECYPAKVTVGDFMKVVENPAIDKKQIALFMPTAQGPCRFGQYAPYLRQILDANGYAEVEILSPTSQNAYDGLGTLAGAFVRTGWRALLAADLLQKLLLMWRPYEERRGDSEHDERHEGEDHAELSGVATEDLLDRVHGMTSWAVSWWAVSWWAVTRWVGSQALAAVGVALPDEARVIRRMSDSWSASALATTPVMAPSKIV